MTDEAELADVEAWLKATFDYFKRVEERQNAEDSEKPVQASSAKKRMGEFAGPGKRHSSSCGVAFPL